MTVPKASPTKSDKVLQTGTDTNSTETEEQPRAASVALIRSWPLSILSLCFFPLLITLGCWQLQRAEEKQQTLNDVDARLASQPQKIDSPRNLRSYTPVRLLGFYTDEYFYLDNRTRNGRVGYEILQIFVSGNSADGKQRWLINRGWLPGGSRRDQLPEVAYPLAAKVITGFVYPNPPTIEADPPNAAVSEVALRSRIQSLGEPLVSGLELTTPDWHIRLSADSDTAFTTAWQLVTTKPEKHRGYAVQWFAMAAVLVVLWLLAATNFRQRVREKWFKKSTVDS